MNTFCFVGLLCPSLRPKHRRTRVKIKNKDTHTSPFSFFFFKKSISLKPCETKQRTVFVLDFGNNNNYNKNNNLIYTD